MGQNFFLDDNGVTIRCVDCVAGDTGIVDGVEYTAVDNASLQAAVGNSETPLNQLCTSLVTNMTWLFSDMTSFNEDISNWDVSSVTNMGYMFYSASAFDQPLDAWDVSSVTDMGGMFTGCDSFDQPLDAWDVSSVTDMGDMFRGCHLFDQPLDAWDVSSVTSMRGMFWECESFDQPLNAWDVSSVTNMVWMFHLASAFDQPLDAWDVSSVTDMFAMFSECESFDQPLDAWDVSSVTSMSMMFLGCETFDQPLDAWDVSSVTNMWFMFRGATSFDQPLDAWDVSSVTDMGGMFRECESFDQPLDAWDVSSVTDMGYMFYLASAFDQPLDAWDVSSVTNMWFMFREAASFDQPIEEWDVSSVTNMGFMFRGCESFDQPLNAWDVSSVTNMYAMFHEAASFDQTIEEWDVSSVTNMGGMFRGCESFDQPLDAWDVSSVTNMSHMFRGATTFNQPLGSWNTESVSNTKYMFHEAASFDQPIAQWDVSNVTDMSYMFHSAVAFNQPLEGWDVSSVTNMNYLFENAQSFNQPLNNWDVSNVQTMTSVFAVTPLFNQPLNQWNVSSVVNMTYMFYLASAFDQDISNWCVQGVTSEPSLFNLDGLLSPEQYPLWGECPGCIENFELSLSGPLCNSSFDVFPSEIPSPLDGNCAAEGVPVLDTTIDHSCWQQSLFIADSANASELIGFYTNMEHSFLGDLQFTMTCPEGQSLTFVTCGPNGRDLGVPVNIAGSTEAGEGFDYFWNENSCNGTMSDFDDGLVLPSATYDVEGDWSLLDGCSTSGIWTLEICDYWAGDNGFVFDWGVVMEDGEGVISMQTASCAELIGCMDVEACNYDSAADYDDGEQCLYVDECGECGGDGTADGGCDCDGNQLDALGVCGGDCLADADADGICDSEDECVGEYDACGVCNGPGPIYECGCHDIPTGNCDCVSIDSDGDGVCDSIDDCFTLGEESESCCSQAIASFDCSLPGISSCSDTLDVAGWQQVDSIEVYFNFDGFGSSWPIDLYVKVEDAAGGCIGFGGYGNTQDLWMDTSCTHLGYGGEPFIDWPASTEAGVFAAVIDGDDFLLQGDGEWMVTIWRTFGNGMAQWQVDVILHGVCGQGDDACSNDADEDGICDFEDDCVGTYDACGVCNGAGETLACGCDPLPDGACDCDGNQLDALGVCGGTCASDVNNNGVCDLDELAQSGASACGDGTVWDEDSQTCVAFDDCPSDLDGNGDVGVSDLLILLSDFGLVCPPEVVEWACGDPLGYQGYDYATVEIFGECWFAENLKAENYASGAPILTDLEGSDWTSAAEGTTAVFGDDFAECGNNSSIGDPCNEEWSLENYGRLYNWYAVVDDRGLCPAGWHVPSASEWQALLDSFPSDEDPSNALKAIDAWNSDFGITNSTGFSAVPAGVRCSDSYNNNGFQAWFWSSDEFPNYPSTAFYFIIQGSIGSADVCDEELTNCLNKYCGTSIRCLQD